MRFVKFLILTFVFPISFVRSQQDSQTEYNSISALHLIGEFVVPHNKIYKATTVGGLSGIDYDPANDDYYMDILGMYIDNIEGVTWGKDVPNGHRTLIFIADNNFEFFEKTQFLVFEVMS